MQGREMPYFAAIVTLLILMFGGCSSKTEKAFLKSFAKEKNYHQKLIKTEKLQFYEENLTKVVLTATYLGENKAGAELFIVGIYADEDIVVIPGTDSLKLRLNGSAPLKIESLSQEDSALKNLSFISEWTSYYRISFPHVESKRLEMKVVIPRFGSGRMHFAKIAKYMIDVLKKRPATF